MFKALILFLSLLASNAFADDFVYKLPTSNNSHPIGGRLFIQGFEPSDLNIVEGLWMDLSVGTTANYSPYFNAGSTWTDPTVSNSYDLTMTLSRGFKLKNHKLEIGGIIRTYNDQEETELSVFLVEFHEVFGAEGHIPRSWETYNGSVGSSLGQGGAIVIGENGQFFVTNADVYLKLAAMNNTEDLGGTVKMVMRVPVSDQDFNTPGAALVGTLFKKLSNKLMGSLALSVNYQNLSAADFNTDMVAVQRTAIELFAGIIYDPGQKGFWYLPVGFRYSPRRVWYRSNPASSEDAYMLYLAINFQHPKGWEWYLTFKEEVINIVTPLVPDFTVETGVRFKIRRLKNRQF